MPNNNEMIVKTDLAMVDELRKVLKRLHYPLEVMLVCSIPAEFAPHSSDDCQERGVFVDHATVHRWAVNILPILALVFRRRKRPVGAS